VHAATPEVDTGEDDMLEPQHEVVAARDRVAARPIPSGEIPSHLLDAADIVSREMRARTSCHASPSTRGAGPSCSTSAVIVTGPSTNCRSVPAAQSPLVMWRVLTLHYS
jgi:hypothetical protein